MVVMVNFCSFCKFFTKYEYRLKIYYKIILFEKSSQYPLFFIKIYLSMQIISQIMMITDSEPDIDETVYSEKRTKTTLLIFVSLFIVSLFILFFTYGLSIINAFNGSFSFVFGYVIGLTFRYIAEGSFIPIIGVLMFFISIWQIISCRNKMSKAKRDE